jgi:hypothetical protein
MKTPAPNMTNDNKTVINLDDARVLGRTAEHASGASTFGPQPALVYADE